MKVFKLHFLFAPALLSFSVHAASARLCRFALMRLGANDLNFSEIAHVAETIKSLPETQQKQILDFIWNSERTTARGTTHRAQGRAEVEAFLDKWAEQVDVEAHRQARSEVKTELDNAGYSMGRLIHDTSIDGGLIFGGAVTTVVAGATAFHFKDPVSFSALLAGFSTISAGVLRSRNHTLPAIHDLSEQRQRLGDQLAALPTEAQPISSLPREILTQMQNHPSERTGKVYFLQREEKPIHDRLAVALTWEGDVPSLVVVSSN